MLSVRGKQACSTCRPLILATAIATATWAKSAAALNIAPVPAAYVPPSADVVSSGALLVACAALTFLSIARLSQMLESKKGLYVLSHWVTGGFFAWALVYTGMARPSKVIAFLSAFAPSIDLSLALVMAGALLVAVPGFQFILQKNVLTSPMCGAKFDNPQKKLDVRLILGALIFGGGWGLTGICPGPALVNLAQPSMVLVGFWICMIAGMVVFKLLPSSSPAAQIEAANHP